MFVAHMKIKPLLLQEARLFGMTKCSFKVIFEDKIASWFRKLQNSEIIYKMFQEDTELRKPIVEKEKKN